MKRIIGLVTVLAALALGMNAGAGSFTAGNVVIYRVGNGSSEALTNIGDTVWLDEYSTNDIWLAATNKSFTPLPVQSIEMPTTWVGSQAPLIGNGAAFGDGAITRSVDGRFLVVPGYAATIGQFTNSAIDGASTTNQAGQTNVARVVGLVDGFGHIYTTTALTNADENSDDIRTAVSTDGTNIWVGGASRGGKFTTRGSMLSTQVEESASNVRVLGIYGDPVAGNNTLYFTAAGRVGSATNPAALLPTTFVANSFTNLAGYTGAAASPWSFALFNMQGGAGPDTLYVCDNVTNAPGEPLNKAGGVLKYCYDATTKTWGSYGYVYAEGATGVTGVKNGANVDLYITEGGTVTPSEQNVLYAYRDASGYKGSPQSNGDGGDANGYNMFLTPMGSAALQDTRGIAFAPVGGDAGTLTGQGSITIGPPYAPNFSGPSGGPFVPGSFTYSVANLGGVTTNFIIVNPVSWLSIAPTSGSLAPGASTTVTLTPNATANTEVGGFTYSGTFTMRPGGFTGTPATPISPTLTVFALFVSPGSNFVANGSPGGPFTPSSYTYAITNATGTPIAWNAYTSTNWNSLSASVQLNSISNTLPAYASTNLTVTIDATANALPVGVYEDTLVISNLNAHAWLTSRFIDLQAGFGFFDDFSTFTQNANLVGQYNWFNPDPDTDVNNPLQVSSGQVQQPGGCNPPDSTSSMSADKNFSPSNVTNGWIYAGMLITVNYAPPAAQLPVNYTLSFYQSFGNGYGTGNLSMVDNGPGPGLTTFKFACQVNAGAHIFAFSGDNFTYGNQYEVYLVVDAGDSNCFLYVNNGGGWDTQNIFNNAAEANDSPCPAFPCNYDPSMGSFHIGNYCNGTPQEGFTIAKLAVSTNYANVYTFLHAAACSPPTASFTPTSASGPAPLTVNFTDTSVANSGSITTWVWTFGDPLNGTSSSQNPSYTYATPGVYTVNLSVTNSCGDGSAAPATATITVLDPFAYWESPSVYNLTGTLTGGNASYTGDGMSNTNKFMAGFSPTSAAAYLHVISIAKSAGTNIVVTYLGANGDSTWVPGIASRTNVLEFTTGTANGSYATNNFASTGQTNILSTGTGTGTITSFVDTNGASSTPSRYYRVRVLVP